MPILTLKIAQKSYKKIADQAKREGFKSPQAWAQHLVEKNAEFFQESPRLLPSDIILEMKKTKLYDRRFLAGLKKSLEYANQAGK